MFIVGLCSIAYHAFRGTKHYLPESKAILDNPNIAVFPGDRMFWNGLLFFVNASQAEALARGGAKPTAEMLKGNGLRGALVEKSGSNLGESGSRTLHSPCGQYCRGSRAAQRGTNDGGWRT